MAIIHPFVTTVVDDGSSTEVGPDEWNASHTVDSSDLYVENEIPSGTINGANLVFTLANSPKSNKISLIRNGMVMQPTGHYSVSGTTLTYITGFEPQTGDWHITSYWRV
jgi:hypothetical protein